MTALRTAHDVGATAGGGGAVAAHPVRRPRRGRLTGTPTGTGAPRLAAQRSATGPSTAGEPVAPDPAGPPVDPAGLIGPVSVTEPIDSAGPTGPTGKVGSTGPAGSAASAGPTGLADSIGSAGSTDLIGKAGPTGLTGSADPADSHPAAPRTAVDDRGGCHPVRTTARALPLHLAAGTFAACAPAGEEARGRHRTTAAGIAVAPGRPTAGRARAGWGRGLRFHRGPGAAPATPGPPPPTHRPPRRPPHRRRARTTRCGAGRGSRSVAGAGVRAAPVAAEVLPAWDHHRSDQG
ncbi:hypothetical protein GCM10009634_77410 [Saccharothrix xinjiangensis]